MLLLGGEFISILLGGEFISIASNKYYYLFKMTKLLYDCNHNQYIDSKNNNNRKLPVIIDINKQ